MKNNEKELVDLFESSFGKIIKGKFGGYLDVRGYSHPLPASLTSVGGYLDVRGYSHPLPASLTSVGGNLYVRGYSHPLPASLTSVGGYRLGDDKSITEIRIGKKKFTIKNVDGYPFVVENEKTSKGIRIYSGYTIVRVVEGRIEKDKGFVAEKGAFTAHGPTIKKAVEDLQFKIVAEKLRNEPIKADTMITPNHYRLITGACEWGTQSWMKENNMTDVREIKAKDLLPILEKTNAYGLERFKKLVTF